MADIKAVIFDLDGTLYDKSRLPFRLIGKCKKEMKGDSVIKP